MKKTRREWLNELKPEHAKLAIENTPDDGRLDDVCESLYGSLLAAFRWRYSRQGNEYWADICSQINNGTYYQKEPSFKHFKILIYLFILIAMMGVAYVLGHKQGFDDGEQAIRKSIIWENRWK